jgi:hypothetical protein
MKTHRILLSMVAVLGFFISSRADLVTGFNDISFWVGSGTNSAALILDFHDGTTSESFAWGYNWNGTASGAGMLIAIAAADANLSISYFGDGDDGFYMWSVSYFDGITTHTRSNGDFITDYDYWGYYLSGGYAGDADMTDGFADTPVAVAGGGTLLPDSWTDAPSGAAITGFDETGRILADNAWDTWSYGEWGTVPGSVVTAAAVPEPASALLIALGSMGIFGFRRYKKYLGH